MQVRHGFLVLAAVPGLALTGCFPRPDYRPLPDQTSILLTDTVRAQSVADPLAPTLDERALLAADLGAVGTTGTRIRIFLPAGFPAPDAGTLHGMTERLGVPETITAIAPVSSGTSFARIEIRHLTVQPPDCARMITPNEAIDSASRPSLALGCATYGNLAAQIADPAELIQPTTPEPSRAAGSVRAINLYLKGRVTPPQDPSSPTQPPLPADEGTN